MNFLRKIIGVRSGEGKETFLFFLYFFFLISAIIIGKTARDVFFLSRFNSSLLPHIFIISSVCVMVTTIFFIRSAQNKNIFTFAIKSGALFVLSLLIINTFLNIWIYPILYVWMDIMGAVLVPQFWLLTNQRFTTRQAKRLFGPIGAASAFANIFIGFLIQSRFILPDYLLPSAAFFLILCLVIISVINNFATKEVIGQNKVDYEKLNKNVSIITSIRNHKYIGLLCLIVSIASITNTLIEYQFKIIASNSYNENQLASLFGMLYVIVGLFSGFMQIFLIGRILRKFGVLIGLLMLPVFLGISSLLLTLSPVIIFALMARLSDLIFRFSFHDTTMQILWLPVSGKLRQSVKPFIEGTVKNSAQGFTGLLILGVLIFIGSQFLNILIMGLIIIWIIISILLKNEYWDELKKAVGKRELDLETLRINITDPYLVNLFNKTLISGNEGQKIFVLNEIKKLSPEPWKNELNEIFIKESDNIRNEIILIALSDKQVLSDFIILDLVNSQDDPLRSMGIIIAAKRQYKHIIPQLENLINDTDPDVRASANIALITLGEGNEQIPNEQLNSMLNEKNVHIQIAAVKALSNFPKLLTLEQLKRYIQSNHRELQILSSKIAADEKIEELLPFLITNLYNSNIFRELINDLRTFDSEKVESLILNILVEKKAPANESSMELIKALGELGSAKSIEILIQITENINHNPLLNAIIHSCNKIGKRNHIPKLYCEQLGELLQNRLQQAYTKLQSIQLIQSLENSILLLDHFQTEFYEEIERIFIILDILYPDEMTRIYIHRLQSTDRSMIANILEIIENRYPEKIREVLIPIIDASSIEEKLNSGASCIKSSIHSIDDIIIDLVESENRWKSALSIDAIINNQLKSLFAKIDWKQALKNPFIQELIAKNINSLDSNILNNIQPFIKMSDIKENIDMYTALDKTIILKGVNLFSGLTGEEVFQIAQISSEERYLPEEIIFREGDVGDSMYIIIDGSVSIYNQKKEITTIGTGECFGEMSLLDKEPRSSSIRALTDTVVLKIEEESFFKLVAGNIEIIQGIVKILSKRLRQSIAINH